MVIICNDVVSFGMENLCGKRENKDALSVGLWDWAVLWQQGLEKKNVWERNTTRAAHRRHLQFMFLPWRYRHSVLHGWAFRLNSSPALLLQLPFAASLLSAPGIVTLDDCGPSAGVGAWAYTMVLRGTPSRASASST
jgi:hypothetical protein